MSGFEHAWQCAVTAFKPVSVLPQHQQSTDTARLLWHIISLEFTAAFGEAAL